jgi:hypothetical protein
MKEIWINKKKKCKYLVLKMDIINATNSSNGLTMTLYCSLDKKNWYIRETKEFLEKFYKEEELKVE